MRKINPEQLLISSQEGLLLFNVKDTCFIDNKLSTGDASQLKASTISRQGENIYIGTNNGLFRYSIGTGRLSTATNALDNKQIQAVLLQSSPVYGWQPKRQALFVESQTGEVKIPPFTGTPQCISSNFICCSLALDSQNRLWIGTFNDLNIYHEGHDSFVSFSSNPVEDGSLSQSSVRSIFMDSKEVCG